MTRYFHGTCFRLQPGDILVPGKEIGKDYGRSSHVYLVTDGFDVSEIENPHQQAQASKDMTLYALLRAEAWAEAALMMAQEEGVPEEQLDLYVYEVQPLGEMEYDGEDFAGPESRRTTAAKVLRVANF